MTTPDGHVVRGVDHTAFVTFAPAETVRFYRDILGFPLAQSVCATGWGAAPDFVHFFFDIGRSAHIAFFYYFGAEPYEDPAISDLLKSARHLALNVETAEHLDDYERRLIEGGYPPYMRVMHETIESIYAVDPNGLNLEITRSLREIGEGDRADAEMTIDALIHVLDQTDPPTLAALWVEKGRRIAAMEREVER